MSESAKPVKIVRIIARLNVGGPAIHVTLLTARLGPPEFSSLLVAGTVPPGEGDMGYYAARHGVEPAILPGLSREVSPLADLKVLWQLVRLLRRERPDIVHTHTAKAGFVGRLAARLAGVPVIVHTFHGHVLSGYFGRRKEALFRRLEQFCARRSTCLLTVSEQVRSELLAKGVGTPEQHRVMELGLDLAPFAAAARRGGALRDELGLDRDTPLIGFCGRLVPIKNPALMLRAFARLRADLPTAHLAVVGDGELRGELEALAAELGVSDSVHFVGWRDELPPLVADLDVMALSSLNEGTPVALIEAAAAGVPAVATRVGGVGDLVDQSTGWLVPSGDEAALAGALAAALSHRDEADARGRAARERALERFSIDRLVTDLAALYRELLDRRRRG